MMEINAEVNVPEVDYMQNLCAANSDSTHYAIVISFGGRSVSFYNLMKILKENNVSILLITSTQGNSLCEYADDIIYMSSFENHYNKISSFSTRMTLLYILDTLYSIYFKKDYEKNISFKLNSYKKMNKELK